MSFWGLLLVVLIAILVIKPERLPEIAYLLGKGFGKLKFWLQHIFQSIHK